MSESVHDPATVVSQYIACTTAEESASSPDSPKEYSDILSGLILSKELSLLQFIQVLGPYLTSESDLIRPKAIQCISDTLASLRTANLKILSRQDLTVLLDFLLTKLDDKSSVRFILQCLTNLCQFEKFITFPPLLEKLLSSFLKDYNPKSYLAKVRYELFVLLKTVLTVNEIVASSAIFDPFIQSFVHVATGEKDPRNLLISFDINILISEKISFDPVQHKELLIDLFDVAFCYFPISFTPPANDPYKITANDLKTKLRSAIAGQSLYAKDSIPSLIEKLTSTNPMVRNDVLKTLKLCVQNYEPEVIEQYWLIIWNALKYEILHNDVSIFQPHEDLIVNKNYDELVNDNDEFKPLIITLDIVSILGSKLEGTDDTIQLIVHSVTDELRDNLSNVKDKVFKQSVLLVALLASSCHLAFDKIMDFLFLYEVWGKYLGNEPTAIEPSPSSDSDAMEREVTLDDLTLTVAKQRDLIDNFGFILNSYNAISSRLLDSNKAEYDNFVTTNHLVNFKDSLLIFLGQLLQSSSNLEKTLKSKTIQQLKKLIQLKGFLSEDECSLIFGYFNDILVETINEEPKGWDKDTVVQEVKVALRSIMDGSSSKNVELIIQTILPNLLGKLPDLQEETDLDVERILSLIGDLCVNYKFLEILSIRLLNKLTYYSQSNSRAYYILTVKLLINSIVKTENNHQFLMNSWYRNFVPRFTKSIVSIVNESEDTVNGSVEELIEVSGDLLAIIVRYIEKLQHESILNDFTECFVKGSKSNYFNIEPPLESLVSKQSVFINLYNKILASVNKPAKGIVKIGTVDALDFIKQDITFAKDLLNGDEISNVYIHLGYLKNLCLIVNKYYDSELSYLAEYYQVIEEASSSTSSLSQGFLQDYEIFVWSIKGLIMKIDPLGISYLNKLITLLSCSNGELKLLISKSLSIIMIDLPLFTNVQQSINHTKLISGVQSFNVRLLYKQRIFEIILPTLIEGFNSSTLSSSKSSYLITLSNILQNIPTKILKPHLSTITPLILTSLSIKDSAILKSSLETCEIIIGESSDIIIPHLQSLIPRLVDIVITPNSVNTEEIRLLSLSCLVSVFTKIELKHVLKFQKSTTIKLVQGLDDKRRSVRKLCSDLRQVLFELGR